MEIRKVLLILCIVAIAYFFLTYRQKEEKNSLDDLDKLGLVLTGKVTAIDELPSSNGFEIVSVDVISSNVSWYDPRDEYENYYCLIKNNKAEFYQHDTRDCNAGDTIEVNIKKGTFTIRMNGTELKKEIRLYDNPDYFRRVEKNFQDF